MSEFGHDYNDNMLTDEQYELKYIRKALCDINDSLQELNEDKRLRKVNVIAMHEAREIISSKNWRSFLAQAVSDVNESNELQRQYTMYRELSKYGVDEWCVRSF